ncbi:MAG: cupin domain-containing protein [Clostridia bacterium]|nr:cupin domain-containing protein [Clostridia bacterium]
MKIVKSQEAQTIKNSDTSKILEYSIALNDKDIDFCINTITGRYPEKGYCMNEKCKEICYILDGEGTLNKKDEITHFESGDVILIEKEEIYYWQGKCKVMMVCTPAWYKEQCKLLDL